MEDLAFRSCDPLTQAEFRTFVHTLASNDLHHYELLDGFVVREPPASWPHGEIEGEVVGRILRFLETDRGLGRVFGSSQGFDLPSGDTVEPDAAFVSAKRWQALTRPVEGFPKVVPDLVVEILSPSTRTIDQSQKKCIYERNGVLEYWLVDPESRSLQCFLGTPDGFDEGRTLAGSEVLASRVLAGLEIPVAELFPEP